MSATTEKIAQTYAAVKFKTGIFGNQQSIQSEIMRDL